MKKKMNIAFDHDSSLFNEALGVSGSRFKDILADLGRFHEEALERVKKGGENPKLSQVVEYLTSKYEGGELLLAVSYGVFATLVSRHGADVAEVLVEQLTHMCSGGSKKVPTQKVVADILAKIKVIPTDEDEPAEDQVTAALKKKGKVVH